MDLGAISHWKPLVVMSRDSGVVAHQGQHVWRLYLNSLST
ncbi:malate synthase G [Comamonas thiooxydans]|nr:malate synthase G [Comamonas thiooxydans]